MAATKAAVNGGGDIEDLRKAVLRLAERVTSLSTALTTVNEIQMRTQESAKENSEQTKNIQDVLVPREEHEAKWREEQEQVISLQRKLRKRIWSAGIVSFLVAGGLFAASLIISHHNLQNINTSRHQTCVQHNEAMQAGIVFIQGRINKLEAEPHPNQDLVSLLQAVLVGEKSGLTKTCP